MDKILTFIINENNEFLILKGNDSDPQFHKSFWYTVTGAKEIYDNSLEDTVKRELKEETNLNAEKVFYLNWIFKYESLGDMCIEYAYITKVKKDKIYLNEENIDYMWLNLNDFVNKIHWFYDKDTLMNVLKDAINFNLYFADEKIEISE